MAYVEIETQGIRHDDPHLFDRPTVLLGVNAMHYPYLVVETVGPHDYVNISTGAPERGPETPIVRLVQVREIAVLLQYPDDTVVLWIWAGQHRSDYFRFTVGEFRAARTVRRANEGLPS